jgi:hypothetical protein
MSQTGCLIAELQCSSRERREGLLRHDGNGAVILGVECSEIQPTIPVGIADHGWGVSSVAHHQRDRLDETPVTVTEQDQALHPKDMSNTLSTLPSHGRGFSPRIIDAGRGPFDIKFTP